jgi:chorismate mutase / prephenate dehydratase
MSTQDHIKPTSAEEAPLADFRKQIDELDDQLVDLLIKRIGIVQQVGELKKTTAPGQCPIRAGREADMVRRIMKQFESSAFTAAAAGAIWRIIIGASTSVEAQLKLSVYTPEGNNDLYWLGREYFGFFNPSTKQPHVKRVIGDVMDNKSSVGILPMPHSSDTDYWWTSLMHMGTERPKIFAQIPFIYPDNLGKDMHAALAIANIVPEETGDDTSLIVLETDFNVSQNRLQTAFATAKLEASWIQIASVNPTSRYHLIGVKGFITEDHKEFQSIISTLGSASVLNTYYLGAYATPIMMQGSQTKPNFHATAAKK